MYFGGLIPNTVLKILFCWRETLLLFLKLPQKIISFITNEFKYAWYISVLKFFKHLSHSMHSSIWVTSTQYALSNSYVYALSNSYVYQLSVQEIWRSIPLVLVRPYFKIGIILLIRLKFHYFSFLYL